MNPTNPYTQAENVLEESFTQLHTGDTDYEPLDLNMPDDDLDKMLIRSLEADRDHWNKAPWKLSLIHI